MEQMPAEFYAAVRAGYLALAEAEPARFRVIDAAGTVEEIGEAIWRHVAPLVET
jgi:dTMP kinase